MFTRQEISKQVAVDNDEMHPEYDLTSMAGGVRGKILQSLSCRAAYGEDSQDQRNISCAAL